MPAPVSLGAGGGQPSELTRRFQALSPIHAPQHFSLLRTAVGRSLATRRATEASAPPKALFRPAPPALAGRTAPAAIDLKADVPAPARSAPGSGKGAAPAPNPPAEHEHSSAAPEVATADEALTALEEADDNDPATLQARLRQWQAHFFSGVPTSDAGLSTDPGPAPHLTLDGEADPARVDGMRADGKGQLDAEAARRAVDRSQDFGENDIGPDLEPEEMSRPLPPAERPGEARCPKAEQIEPFRFDQEDDASLSRRVSPKLAGRYEEQAQRVGAAERNRDQGIRRAREEGDLKVARAHQEAHARELGLAGEGRREVAALRGSWAEDDRELLEEFDDEVDPESRRVTLEVQGHAGTEQKAIDTRREQVRQQAVDAETDAKRQSEDVKRQGEQESGSWLVRAGRWVKDKVKRLASWVSEKISAIFAKLRATIKQWFDDFKAWALEKIEQARRWAIDQLENLRTWLHAKVDKYLGRFPAVARFFKQGIDLAIDSAEAGVNAAADGLKKAVAFIIDGVAAFVDGALAFVENVAQVLLWSVCNLLVLGVNLVVLAVEQDLNALIELIHDLPEPAVLGPIWPAIKYGLLGYLRQLRDKPVEEKKRYERKTRWLVVNPAYYAGAFYGILKGFVWDGLFGLVTMFYEIVVGIPQALGAMFDFFRRMLSDVEAIEELAAEAGRLWGDVRAFLQRPDAKEQILAAIKRAPEILYGMVRELTRAVKGWAYNAGARAADAMFAFVLKSSPFDIGVEVGRVVGQAIFEIALLLVSAGAGTLAKWGAKVVHVLAKAGMWLAKGLRGGRVLLRALGTLRTIVLKGVQMAQRVGGALRGLFARLERLVARVFEWLERSLGRLGKKVGGKGGLAGKTRKALEPTPQDLAWREFKRELRVMALGYRTEGVTRAVLKTRVTELVRIHRKVVSGFVILKKGPYWRIVVKRKGWHRPRTVASAYMDRASRWKAGKKAIERAVARLPGFYGVPEVEAAIMPLRRRYGFHQLTVEFNHGENLFDIKGSMSPLLPLAKVVPPTPPTRVHPVTYNAGLPTMHADPLSAKGPRGTPTTDSVDPRYYNSVKLIRSRGGSRSLYVKGHMLWAGGHGQGTDPDNLTWITRSLNATMFWMFERLIGLGISGIRPKRLRKVFNYKVEALPGYKHRPQRRYIQGQWTRIPDERRLAKALRITLIEKAYEPTQRKWVDKKHARAPETLRNVPPYPPGYKE